MDHLALLIFKSIRNCFADMISRASNLCYFPIWENGWMYRNRPGIKVMGPGHLVGSVDCCSSNTMMTMFESIAGTLLYLGSVPL